MLFTFYVCFYVRIINKETQYIQSQIAMIFTLKFYVCLLCKIINKETQYNYVQWPIHTLFT